MYGEHFEKKRPTATFYQISQSLREKIHDKVH